MNTEKAYCPGCGHKVRLVLTDPPPHSGQANLPDGGELVCLDYQQDCSGGMCPLSGKSGIVMGVRLARSHMNEESFATIQARCSACGQVSEMDVLDESFAYCRVCDTTNRWVMLRLENGSGVALTEV